MDSLFIILSFRFLTAGLRVDPCRMHISIILLKMLSCLRRIFQAILLQKGWIKPVVGQFLYLVVVDSLFCYGCYFEHLFHLNDFVFGGGGFLFLVLAKTREGRAPTYYIVGGHYN